jgi:hypothetical protein
MTPVHGLGMRDRVGITVLLDDDDDGRGISAANCPA